MVKFIKEDEERLAKLEADRAAGRVGGADAAAAGVKVEVDVGTPWDAADAADAADGTDAADPTEGADATAADVGTPVVQGEGIGHAVEPAEAETISVEGAEGTPKADAEGAVEVANDDQNETAAGDSGVQTPPPASPGSTVRKVSGTRRGAEEMEDADDRAEGVKRVRTGDGDAEMGDEDGEGGLRAEEEEGQGAGGGSAAEAEVNQEEQGEARVSTPPA